MVYWPPVNAAGFGRPRFLARSCILLFMPGVQHSMTQHGMTQHNTAQQTVSPLVWYSTARVWHEEHYIDQHAVCLQRDLYNQHPKPEERGGQHSDVVSRAVAAFLGRAP
jgi:hypothetical protein